ncbi:serine protease [Pseudomonas syringae pv. syringae]|nr:serine protease [Pseudomonas syringae pv. syringae]
MMSNLSVGEELLYTTIKITSNSNGVAVSTGSGFLFTFSDDKGEIPVIITNKHVIHGCESITAIFHTEKHSSEARPFARITIDLNETNLVLHHDQDTDLCAILIGMALNEFRGLGNSIFFRNISKEQIPSAFEWSNFDAIETVTMIGCPNGLSDEVNNFPIARQGITASHVSRKYNGKNEFLIDMACFPGSSGSPVFIYNRDGYYDKQLNSYIAGMTRLKLLGILHAGPTITAKGALILSNPTTFELKNMMHLGYVIKSDEILRMEHDVLEITKRADELRESRKNR